jgi:hypothetical protein
MPEALATEWKKKIGNYELDTKKLNGQTPSDRVKTLLGNDDATAQLYKDTKTEEVKTAREKFLDYLEGVL